MRAGASFVKQAIGDEGQKQLARFAKIVGAVPGLVSPLAISEPLDDGKPADIAGLEQELSDALREQDFGSLS